MCQAVSLFLSLNLIFRSYNRAPEEIDEIAAWLKNVTSFRILPTSVIRAISEKVRLREYKKGQACKLFISKLSSLFVLVCFQGEPGDCLYIIYSGSVKCIVNGVHVATYKAGEAVGQTALDGAIPRSSTLLAACPTTILRLERDDYSFTMQVTFFFNSKIQFIVLFNEAKRRVFAGLKKS